MLLHPTFIHLELNVILACAQIAHKKLNREERKEEGGGDNGCMAKRLERSKPCIRHHCLGLPELVMCVMRYIHKWLRISKANLPIQEEKVYNAATGS